MKFLRTEIDKRKLWWLGRLEKQENHRWTKKIWNEEWERERKRGKNDRTWKERTYEIIKKYGMENEWQEMIQKPERQWLSYVEDMTTKKMIEDWNREINQSSKLKEYSKIKESWGIEKYILRKLEPGRRLKIKFRSGTSGLMEELGRRQNGEKKCPNCDENVDETVEHLLVSCIAYDNTRKEYLDKLLEIIKGKIEEDKIDSELLLGLMLGRWHPNLTQAEIDSIDEISVSYFASVWTERNKKKFNPQSQCEESKTSCYDAAT